MGTECQFQIFSTYNLIKVIVLIIIANLPYLIPPPHLKVIEKDEKVCIFMFTCNRIKY